MGSKYSTAESQELKHLEISGELTLWQELIFCDMQDLRLKFHSVKVDMWFHLSVNRRFFPMALTKCFDFQNWKRAKMKKSEISNICFPLIRYHRTRWCSSFLISRIWKVVILKVVSLLWLNSDFTPRNSKKSKLHESDYLFENFIKNKACMRNLSPWMHAQVLIFPKNICDGFDGKTSSYMGESENFLHPGNPYLLERPLIRQFSAKS